MTLSVLISVYKNELPDNLEQAIQSVWDDQINKPNEIVLVQDGPVGGNLSNVILHWKQKLGSALVVLENETNLGLTKSMIKGISVIKNDLIARMDSDDISMPNRFFAQIKFMEEHPEVSVVGGSIQEFNSSCDNLAIRKYPLTHSDILHYIYKASPLAHPTVMMRREVFDKVMYDERYRTSQDIALWYDAICVGFKLANIPEVVLKFRRGEDTYKRRSRSKAWNEFKIYMCGIRRVYGLFTFKYVFPISRLIFRLLPTGIVKKVYNSSARTKFLQK